MRTYNFRRSFILLVVAGVYVAINAIGIYSIRTLSEIKNYLPLLLSSTAVIISLTSAFKNEIFPLILKANVGDILLASRKGKSSAEDFILVARFLNFGYVDTEIENVFARLVDPNGIKRIYHAQIEIDEPLFESIRKKGLPNVREGNEHQLFSFSVNSKSSIQKYIPFHYESKEDFLNWIPGEYRFELHVKVWQIDKLLEVAHFYHHFDLEEINTFELQGSYLIRSRISPLIERQLNILEDKTKLMGKKY